MKKVEQLAIVDKDKCVGCRTCEKICPVLAIKVVDKKAIVDIPNCTGCSGCQQRCMFDAIKMVHRDDPYVIEFKWESDIKEEVDSLCRDAHFNPQQIICYCTETRAQEVAAAIIKGNDTPEKISRVTGIRTGCKIECIQPILRLLNAAGIKPERPEGGYQWYGLTPTVFDIPEDIIEKYSDRGFNFKGDKEIFEEVRDANLNVEKEGI